MTDSNAAAENDTFDSEVFEYWIPRLVADGVDANDVQTVRPNVSSWNDWPGAWASVAGGNFKHGAHIANERDADNAPLLGDLYITLLQRLGMDVDQFANARRNLNHQFA